MNLSTFKAAGCGVHGIVSHMAAVLSAILFACACGSNQPLPKLEEGEWYRVSTSDFDGFVRVDTDREGVIGGEYYSCAGWPVADGHDFVMNQEMGRLHLSVDGEIREAIDAAAMLESLRYSLYETPAFTPGDFDSEIYRKPQFSVIDSLDIVYGTASGFYTSMPGYESNPGRLFSDGMVNSLVPEDLELTMDVYMPQDPSGCIHPLILFIHGGAFLGGDKAEPAYQDFCRWFASLGYVTASINYRIGFLPYKSAIQRAGYRAVQDANAALRFLSHYAGRFGIDPGMVFVAGSSAGAITALNMVFMDDTNKPSCAYGDLLHRDLGPIAGTANDFTDCYEIKGVASMWGAINDLTMLASGHADLILFHGDADHIVPYGKGQPFNQLGDWASELVFDPMYGSRSMADAAASYGIDADLHTFTGCGHALNVDDDNMPNANHYVIRGAMGDFFFAHVAGEPAHIEKDSNGVYKIAGEDITVNQWKVDGGFLMGGGNGGPVKVLWCADARRHVLSACGEQGDGLGFELDFEEE